jgi:hypothetical protein
MEIYCFFLGGGADFPPGPHLGMKRSVLLEVLCDLGSRWIEINCCFLFLAERLIQQDCFMHFHAVSKKWISPISIQLGTP